MRLWSTELTNDIGNNIGNNAAELLRDRARHLATICDAMGLDKRIAQYSAALTDRCGILLMVISVPRPYVRGV